jgi:myosin heavy subunit
MKSLLKFGFVLLILATPIYLFRQTIKSNIYRIYAPCSRPIPYSLGTFDSQFGISREYFLSAIRDAEAIWEKPSGKDLFVYEKESGHLKMNLIYDYRQQAVDKLKTLGITVDDNRASYDALKAKYNTLKSQYATIKANYDVTLREFNSLNREYSDQVQYWNSRGGAPKEQYDKLNTEKITLQNKSTQLESIRVQLNETVNEINSLVVVLNRQVNSLNLTVEKYNTIGSSLGESFEEGLYQSNAGNEEIDIYEFGDRNQLVRVLAHELGHALGLDHVADPKAIMYKTNQSTNASLAQADITALQVKCGQ